MKRYICGLLFLATCFSVSAQWNNSNSPNVFINTGKVGVGTSTPQTDLDVDGHVNIGGTFANAEGFNKSLSLRGSNHSIFRVFGGAVSAAFFADNTVAEPQSKLGTFSNHSFGLLTNGQVRLFAASSGNIGIGTNTPQYKLEVAGWGQFSGRISQSGAVANDNNAAFNNTDPTGYGLYSQGGAGTHYAFHFLNQPGQTIMYGSGDGKVGIGAVPSTDAKLFVQGRMIAQNEGVYARGDKGSVILAAQTGYYDKPSIYSINTIGQVQDLLINPAGGNVGIGTSTPGSFKLAVNGKIWTQEVNVQMTNPGPDYVFEPTYNLTPLSEVETYIKANKHLPEVPSAKEMEEEGLNLKEMNLLLLKKVEELTLHLIEMKKENELLKRSDEQLRNRIEKIENR